jgi:hypothetical protein
MKQREKCSGREFDSPHLHQKHIGYIDAIRNGLCVSSVLLMGVTRFRQGNK